MKIDLGALPFDHYQRYATSARLVEALGDEVSTLLEVGANRQRLLQQFLPNVRCVFSDLAPLPDMDRDFVQADATALPFSDCEFDVTVCLDVIEHMPSDVRTQAISEMIRVSRRMVVVAFPVDKQCVHEAEARANSYWRHLFGTEYPWLQEHQEFGLVDGGQIETALRAGGMRVIRFGHADVKVWAGLMGAHFIKEKFPELHKLVAAADHLYNASVFPGDRGENCYREFLVAVREEADLARVNAAAMFSERHDESAAAFLESLADGLKPLADRASSAESAWSETAEYARRAEAGAARASDEWRIAAARVREVEALLDNARSEWAATAERVCLLEAEAGQLTGQIDAVSTALESERSESARLRASEARLKESEEYLRARLVLVRRLLWWAGLAVTVGFAAGAAYWIWIR